MHDLNAFFPKYALEVEVLHVQRAAHFAGSIVPDARTARPEAAVRNVELVPVSPGAALWNFGPFVIHISPAEIILNHLRDGTALDERCQNLHRKSQIRSHAGHIGLGA